MSPFPWHPVDLFLKLALAPHSWFDALLEWYTRPGDFSRGTYFGLARWGNAGSAGGYLATQNWKGEFRECEFPLEELEALEKTLKAISISLGSSVFAFDGTSGTCFTAPTKRDSIACVTRKLWRILQKL